MIGGMSGASLNNELFFTISLALLFRTAYSSDMTFTTSLSNEDFLMTDSTTYQILLWMILLPLGVIAFLIMFPLNLIWLAWAIHYFI